MARRGRTRAQTAPMGNHVSQAQGSQTRSRQTVAKYVGFPPTDAIGRVVPLATGRPSSLPWALRGTRLHYHYFIQTAQS